jgi:hypothetical protein
MAATLGKTSSGSLPKQLMANNDVTSRSLFLVKNHGAPENGLGPPSNPLEILN